MSSFFLFSFPPTLLYLHTAHTPPPNRYLHYQLPDIRVVIPSSTELCQSFRIPGRAAFYRHRMTVDWIPLALGDIGLLSGVLLAACRHLAAMYMRMHTTTTEKKDTEMDRNMDMNMNMDKSRYGWQELSTLAIQYKLVCLRSLTSTLNMKGDAIKREEGLGDLALAKVIALGIDEVCIPPPLNGFPRIIYLPA